MNEFLSTHIYTEMLEIICLYWFILGMTRFVSECSSKAMADQTVYTKKLKLPSNEVDTGI